MANERRLKELGALAQVFAQFQEPQLAQAQLAQRGRQSETEAMLNALGLVQQRKEAEQRASEADIRNKIAMRQLGLQEEAAPVTRRQAEEEILRSQAERELGPRKVAATERQAMTAEEQNRIEREKLGAGERAGQQTRLVDLLTLLGQPGMSEEQQGFTSEAVRGQPGFEGVTRAGEAKQKARRERFIESQLPALRSASGKGREALRPAFAQYPGAFEEAVGRVGPEAAGVPPSFDTAPAVLSGVLSPGVGTVRALDKLMERGTRPPPQLAQALGMMSSLTPGVGTLSLLSQRRKKQKEK